MDNATIVAIVTCLITGLLSAGGWKFYEAVLTQKAEARKEEKNERLAYRDDLIKRVEKLSGKKINFIEEDIQSKQGIERVFKQKNKFGYSYFKIKKNAEDSIIEFKTKKIAVNFIDRISKKFNLCPKLNGLDNSSKFCFQFHLKSCNGACNNIEKSISYNARFEKSISEIYNIPKNCKLVFHDDKFSTFINIKNKSVSSFGVKNYSFFKINYPSNDEIKIITSYQKILVPETIL